MGSVIENWAAVYGYTWEIGEDVMKDGSFCLRSLSNPKTDGDNATDLTPTGGYPDTYHGQYWDYNNAAHTNCTVLDHWFYLLSEGGSGTNDLGNSYHVDGIGIDKAADIVWKAEQNYLHTNSDYAGAREAMISAAADLYGGTCSNEAVQVEEAWYAVGVGDAPPFIYISGESAFCSSATYSLSETDGGTVSWSASPSGIVSLTPSGNSVTATKIAKGDVTLTAMLTRSCGVFTTSRDISTDPKVDSISSIDQGCYNGYESWSLSAYPNMPNATNWQWSVDNPNSDIDIDNPNGQSTNADVPGGKGGGVSITYQDACGETSDKNGVTIWGGSCQYNNIEISPNPASKSITITIQQPENKTFKAMKSSSVASIGLAYIKEVKIYDAAGRLRKQQVFSGKSNQVQMDVSTLLPAIYLVQVSDGKNITVQKLAIQ